MYPPDSGGLVVIFGVQYNEQLLQKDMLLCQIAPEALNAPGRAKFSFA
jgi:hypothetical protein